MANLLIGTGPMAVDYAKVLGAQDRSFTVIGRSEESANVFSEKVGIKPITGGLRDFLNTNTMAPDTSAIVATGTEALMDSLLMLTQAGIKKILIEKPAALSIDELLGNKETLQPFQDNIFVAYNRRFYSSVFEAEKLIEEDGGLRSMHFEFTEWSHRIEPLQKAAGVKENWFFANSTHVIDTAYFIAGIPARWNAYSKPGNLTWHSKSNFAGAGITEKEVLFSYLSNWESAGRWGIELLTNNRRIYLKPLEELWIQDKGSLAVYKHDFDDDLDKSHKPGLYKQVEAFLSNDKNERLIDLRTQILNSENIYRKIIEG